MFRKLLVCAALVAGSAAANAGPVLLDEGFDSLGNLPGWGAAYLSSPPGETGWFQGNSGIFAAESGAADSYIAANYLNAAPGGNIDTWLATPLLNTASGAAVLTFAARVGGALPGDNLEILINTVGSDLISDFVSLGDISGLPVDAWGFYTFSYEGYGPLDVRFAFRYHVTDTSSNGDYLGIDSVTVNVPEPETLALMAVGMLLTPLVLRRRRKQI